MFWGGRWNRGFITAEASLGRRISHDFEGFLKVGEVLPKLDLGGDPNRMSFELNLNTNAELWLVEARLANAWRTVSARSADAWRSSTLALVRRRR